MSILMKFRLKGNVFVASLKVMIKKTDGRDLPSQKENMTVALYINGLGEVAFRPMFCARALPRSKKKTKLFILENMFI